MFELSLNYLIIFTSLLVVSSVAVTALVVNHKSKLAEADLLQQQLESEQKVVALEQQSELLKQQQELEQQQLQQQQQQWQQDIHQLQQELQQQRNSEQSLRQQLQQQQLDGTRWQERSEALQRQHETLQQELSASKSQLETQQQQRAELETQLATEQQSRQQQQQHNEEKLQLLQENKEQLLKEFELLSQKVLEQKTQQFNEQNKQQTEQQKQGLDALLNPFRQQLDGLRKKVEDVHLHDAKDRATLRTQITELHKLNQQMSSEAQALTTALRGEQKVQGNWGEMVLETVLERSGLRAGEEYVREQSHHDDSGQRYRPDVIINLPEGKHIIVDSKVSLTAYSESVNAETDEQREAALKRHVESVRIHIKSLSEKAYQQLEGLNSPDFVFLFMPIEPAFMAAFQQDEQLFNEAFERRIVVVTPTTLLATLRTVASLWAIERRNRNTEKIADQARLVYEKVVSLVDYMEKLGKQLNTAQGTYDDAWKSLKQGRGNLLSRADNFQKLGVRVKKELARNLVEEANAEAELHEALATDSGLQAAESPSPKQESLLSD
ncbi:DNA recombination protein RmuC [Bacterioplanoides sp.]|uniref:DNA recombination protein RmuC n=1 Tax=Bacterioplanoides sp. TaxID=2066072 RepID=UPI003B597C33